MSMTLPDGKGVKTGGGIAFQANNEETTIPVDTEEIVNEMNLDKKEMEELENSEEVIILINHIFRYCFSNQK